MRFLIWLGLLMGVLAVPLVFLSPAARNVTVGTVLPFLRGGAMIETSTAGLYNRLMPPSSSEKTRLARSDRLVHELELQVLNSRNAGEENRELRAYHNLPLPPAWRLLVAPVVARDPVTWNRRFRIGKGSVDGVIPGAAVLVGNTLMGRVIEVTAGSALVVTVADPACRVSVSLPARDAVGILNGRVGEYWHHTPLCEVTFLPRDNGYQDGDVVVSSGLSGNMPAGLPVGQVVAGENGKAAAVIDASYAKLQIRPAAAFGNVRFVGVVVATAALDQDAVTFPRPAPGR